jgi:beta-1,4-mannosyltransferase
VTVLPFPGARSVAAAQAVGASATGSAVGSRLVRVVHVPGEHTYVRHVSTPAGAVDPSPVPVHLDWSDEPVRGARRMVAAGVDVLHVHFGFERCTPDRLAAVLDAWADAGLPFVWTAHDLTNPHLVDQSSHEEQLALLAERAAVVLTLTDGAAAEITRRWGRRAVVVPHPHLAPPQVLSSPRPPQAGPPVVGVPLGMLRPGTDPAVVLALLDVMADRPDVTLRVRLREEVLAPGFPRPDPHLVGRLQEAERAGRVDLRVGPRLAEDELWQELRGLAALVLPYRWGSHSGWVESCYDVGTPVVAPALGHWAEQQDVHTFRAVLHGASSGTDGSLAAAVDAALAQGPRPGSVRAERLREREHVVRAHALVHRLAAAGGEL